MPPITPQDNSEKIALLESRIAELENLMRYHQHIGNDTQQINAEDIFGLFGNPEEGNPMGIQRANVGDGFRLWLFPKDEVIIAPENPGTILRGVLVPFAKVFSVAGTDTIGTSTYPWSFIYLNTLEFTARNVTSLSAGQMAYHDNAGTQQFRVNAGGFFGSIDLTGV